ncbi:CMRF35-like molecule 6 [Bubalus bubalis]|uniref:CMRF35-like molecule 6 n=1 Tax=Bubalus bubalis TaxID=89462 RepID=UPI001E1B7BD5|nr:CMRF35-like molecule 6 [Bubalus bubalis]
MSVECEYQEAFVDDIKYWCKHPCMSPWRIVETRESEREMRRGRVSIRDRPASLTFTVTLESLREEDVGTVRFTLKVTLCLFLDFSGQPYGAGTSRASRGHCSVVEGSWGPSFAVVVLGVCRSLSMTATSPKRSTSTPESPTTLAVPTWSAVSGQEAPDPSQAHRVHFLLLVFLKVPVLLGMLRAALWVNRPLRSSADRQSQSIYKNW